MRIIKSYGLEKDCWIIGRQVAEGLLWFLLFWLLTGTARAGQDVNDLLDAIKQVESGGRADAVGDDGLARGAYQIHKAYWIDGCRLLKVDWPYSQAFDEAKSRRIVRAYLAHYGKAYEKKTGRAATLEVLASLHNAGPKGYLKMNKPGVKKYIAKIKKELAKQKT